MGEERWLHGTRHWSTRGGVLLPRSQHSGAPTNAPVLTDRAPLGDADEWVYATRDLDLAWAYAWAAPGRGKPKVLVLELHGDVEPDPEHSVGMDAWRCRWAKVRHVLTEPSVTEAEARAGWATEGNLR